MTGSKKAFGQYLGLDAKQLEELWRKCKLQSPANWFRDLKRIKQLELLAKYGSYKVMSKQIGCSESTLRLAILGPKKKDLAPDIWTEDMLIGDIKRYGSVRLMARCLKVTEAQIRRLAKAHEIDLTPWLNYSFGENANAKGRRAELEYAKFRGDAIIEDCNLSQGSQATTDFIDREYGRVNVKSSQRYKYKASTRQGNPYYWKFSTSSLEKSDHVAILCYDDKMLKLLGYAILPVTDEIQKTKSCRIQQTENGFNVVQAGGVT